MEKLVILDNIYNIKETLYEFDDVFIPNISEKIKNFHDYAEKLLKNAVFYEMKEENKKIGFVVFYLNKETKIGYLTLLAVKNEYQSLGFGKKLLEVYENISKKEKMTVLKLEVFNKNLKVINFYKKFGFNLQDKASDESSYMIKKLK